MFDFTSFLIATTVALFIKFDGPKIIYNTFIPRYERFRSLNRLVASRHPKNGNWKERLLTNGAIFVDSISILSKYMYRNAVQWATDNVKMIDKNTYEISYVIDGRMHKMITGINRGPKKILQISDHSREDVTDLVHAYTGPRGNWHGHEFTPLFFKRQSLTFELHDGTEITFKDDEVIDLNSRPVEQAVPVLAESVLVESVVS